MLHEIKVLKINATEIYANLVENLNDFQIKEINAKQRINFKWRKLSRRYNETKLVETTETKLNV